MDFVKMTIEDGQGNEKILIKQEHDITAMLNLVQDTNISLEERWVRLTLFFYDLAKGKLFISVSPNDFTKIITFRDENTRNVFDHLPEELLEERLRRAAKQIMEKNNFIQKEDQ